MSKYIDLKFGDVLKIGDTEVRLEKKSGQLARLVITADKSIEVKHMRMSASNNMEQPTHGKYPL